MNLKSFQFDQASSIDFLFPSSFLLLNNHSSDKSQEPIKTMSMPTKTTHRRSNRNQREFSQRKDIFSNRSEKKSSTASEAQNIQKSLMRTQMLLKNESQRVSSLATAIEEDGKLLQETADHHKSLDINKAGKALKGLERAQQHEQRVLMASVSFFFLVVSHVLYSRIVAKFGLEGIYSVIFGEGEEL